MDAIIFVPTHYVFTLYAEPVLRILHVFTYLIFRITFKYRNF